MLEIEMGPVFKIGNEEHSVFTVTLGREEAEGEFLEQVWLQVGLMLDDGSEVRHRLAFATDRHSELRGIDIIQTLGLACRRIQEGYDARLREMRCPT